jgi:hypothetical protein
MEITTSTAATNNNGSPANSVSPDLEKGPPIAVEPVTTSSSDVSPLPQRSIIPIALKTWNDKIENLAGFEARGITRVLPEERHGTSLSTDFQMGFLWFSANLTANILAVGFLGPLVFSLGFVDSAMCAVFGSFLGCVLAAYMSIWGAQSGNRTMVRCYPSRSHVTLTAAPRWSTNSEGDAK